MFAVGNKMVDIDGELFPAVNIQIWECYPELNYVVDTHNGGVYSGVYFEVMFENGYNAAVYQEAAGLANKISFSLCSVADLDHFVVEITHRGDMHREIIMANHCVGEDELKDCLLLEKEMQYCLPIPWALADA